MFLNSVKYGTSLIEFNIQRKARLKNTYIQVSTDGVLVKTDKKTSLKEINEMVEKKSAWITKKIELFKSIAINNEITTGSRLYYLGKNYYVHIKKDNNEDKIKVKFIHSKFIISTPSKYSKKELHRTINIFYKQKAIEKITPLTEKLAKEMQVFPTYIGFRNSKTRWGSCSSTNRISFNYNLIKLPTSLIKYVIIHELAHIKHKNHSKEFWLFVQKYMSDYKEKMIKIREFEKII